MKLGGFDFLLWALGFLGHLIVLVMLLFRHRLGRLPIFSSLIITSLVRTIVLFLVARYGTKQTYFWCYWTLGMVDAALELAVVYELASLIFRPLQRWAPDLRRAAFWPVLASFAVAAGLTWLASPTTNTFKEVVVIKVSLFSAALMGELFVVMVAISATAGLPWKSHAARIAQGLGLYSIVDIVIEAGHNLFGVAYKSSLDVALSRTRMVAFLVCLAYWAWAVWQEEPEPRALSDQMRLQLVAFQRRTAAQVALFRNGRSR